MYNAFGHFIVKRLEIEVPIPSFFKSNRPIGRLWLFWGIFVQKVF